MATQDDDFKKPNIKTYVKGTFLFSEDGLQYRERNTDGKLEQKIVEDRIGFLSLQKQIQKEKTEKQDKDKTMKKRNNSVVDKPTLIPIKDTPVDPLPEPQMQSKCERATQEQFEYFQSYISQREKQKKFQQAEEREIEYYMAQKEKFSQVEAPPQVALLFQKQQKEKIKPKKLITIKVKKRQTQQKPVNKVRVLNDLTATKVEI